MNSDSTSNVPDSTSNIQRPTSNIQGAGALRISFSQEEMVAAARLWVNGILRDLEKEKQMYALGLLIGFVSDMFESQGLAGAASVPPVDAEKAAAYRAVIADLRDELKMERSALRAAMEAKAQIQPMLDLGVKVFNLGPGWIEEAKAALGRLKLVKEFLDGYRNGPWGQAGASRISKLQLYKADLDRLYAEVFPEPGEQRPTSNVQHSTSKAQATEEGGGQEGAGV